MICPFHGCEVPISGCEGCHQEEQAALAEYEASFNRREEMRISEQLRLEQLRQEEERQILEARQRLQQNIDDWDYAPPDPADTQAFIDWHNWRTGGSHQSHH